MDKIGITDIIEIDRLITTNLELDDLKELVIVNKYFNSVVNLQFPKLHKTLILLEKIK